MNKFLLATVVIAAAFATVFADAPVSVSINLSHAKENATKSGDDKNKQSSNMSYGGKSTEVKNSVYEYEGRISCVLQKDKPATVTLEAYFVTRDLGTKGAKDEVSDRMEIGTFEFGGENPKQHKFTLTSPAITQTTETTVHGGWRSRSVNKEKTGKRLMGVIVRAVSEGKTYKVISEPSNMKWIAAGKKETVELN